MELVLAAAAISQSRFRPSREHEIKSRTHPWNTTHTGVWPDVHGTIETSDQRTFQCIPRVAVTPSLNPPNGPGRCVPSGEECDAGPLSSFFASNSLDWKRRGETSTRVPL